METRESGFKRRAGMTNLLLESCGEVRAFFQPRSRVQLPLRMDTRAPVYILRTYVAT